MTEAEKAMFYATILAGVLVSLANVPAESVRAIVNDRKDQDTIDAVVTAAIELGDELRAQLLERDKAPF